MQDFPNSPNDRFPFEDAFRQRFTSFRKRKRHGLATLLDIVWMIATLSLIIVFLTFVLFVLVLALFAAPFVIVALAIARRISPPRRLPEGTIIDVEVERR